MWVEKKMNKNLVLAFLSSVVLYSYYYTYQEGLAAGAMVYKKSIHMQMALESAYNFGFADGRRSK